MATDKNLLSWKNIGIAVLATFFICAIIGGQPTVPAPQTYAPTSVQSTPTQASKPQNGVSKTAPVKQNTSQTSESNIRTIPKNSDGTIAQLKIIASAESRSIAFSSEANYTNCSNKLTAITVDNNQQPVFTTYIDTYSTGLNLFTGDQHSIAYGSLTDENGDTLAADINSGMYGSNAAGTWALTCDQGQYSLVISAL